MNHKRWQVSVMVAFAWVLWARSEITTYTIYSQSFSTGRTLVS
jgi:hypothetical protein